MILAASQQAVRYRLASFSAWAVGVHGVRHSSVEEEVVESYLPCSQQDKKRALALAQLIAEP